MTMGLYRDLNAHMTMGLYRDLNAHMTMGLYRQLQVPRLALVLSRGVKIALYLSFICPFQFLLSSILFVFGGSLISHFIQLPFALLSSILTSLFSL